MIAHSDLAILKQMRLFDQLTADELDQIVSGMQIKSVRKGDILFNQGDEARHFYGVLSGWVQIYRDNASGERAVLNIFGRQETFAEAAMFVGGRYPANAEVIEPGRLCLFSRKAFGDSVKANPKLCMAMLGSVSRHLHNMVLQVEQLKTRNAEQRLAQFLLQLCTGRSGPCELTLPYDKALVAARLGMKPESLSRNLARLSSAGVRVNGHTVTISSIEELEDHCRITPFRRSSAPAG